MKFNYYQLIDVTYMNQIMKIARATPIAASGITIMTKIIFSAIAPESGPPVLSVDVNNGTIVLDIIGVDRVNAVTVPSGLISEAFTNKSESSDASIV